MTDEQTTAHAETTEAVESDSPDTLGDGGKRALDAERKARSAAESTAKELQAQLDALKDSKLTETERLQKRIDELAASYEAAQVDATRNRVASEEGIPASLVSYLAGSDEAALRSSAQVLKSAIAEASKPGTPAPDPSQGSAGGASAGSTAAQFEAFFNGKN